MATGQTVPASAGQSFVVADWLHPGSSRRASVATPGWRQPVAAKAGQGRAKAAELLRTIAERLAAARPYFAVMASPVV